MVWYENRIYHVNTSALAGVAFRDAAGLVGRKMTPQQATD